MLEYAKNKLLSLEGEMTISYRSKRLKWTVLLIVVLVCYKAFPTPRELRELSEIDTLIERQNQICSMIEGSLQNRIESLYGVPQELQIPNIVMWNLRAKYVSSSIHTDAGVEALDEALFACTTRKKYKDLVDKIYDAVYPGRYMSAD